MNGIAPKSISLCSFLPFFSFFLPFFLPFFLTMASYPSFSLTCLYPSSTIPGTCCGLHTWEIEGHRLYCESHHRAKKLSDGEYKARTEVFNADRALIAANANVVKAERELEAYQCRRRCFTDKVAEELRNICFTRGRICAIVAHEARERMYPGIYAAEAAAEAIAKAQRDAQQAAKEKLVADAVTQLRREETAHAAAAFIAALGDATAAEATVAMPNWAHLHF